LTTETIQQIYKHGSVRAYRPDPVPPDLVESLVAAGQRGSTSSNLQTYSVVAVVDEDRRGKMASLCADQGFIRQAPVFLAWCVDLSRLDRICQARGRTLVSNFVENFLVAAMDASIAMQTTALAAESLGFGICFVGAIRNHPLEVVKLLGLPRLVFPVSGMALGWPLKAPMVRPRLPTRIVLHWERYNPADETSALEEYDQAMIETGIYDGRQVPVSGISRQDKAYGWQEHSSRRVSSPVRTHLRQELGEQGFELQ
jgi:FMN reductase (NADPH)